MAEGTSKPPATGYLKPKGRAFVGGALTMLVLMQTGGRFDWPVFSWFAANRPSVSIQTTEDQP